MDLLDHFLLLFLFAALGFCLCGYLFSSENQRREMERKRNLGIKSKKELDAMLLQVRTRIGDDKKNPLETSSTREFSAQMTEEEHYELLRYYMYKRGII